MRRFAILAAVAALPGACSPAQAQTRGGAIAKTAGAVGVVGAGAMGSIAIHDRSARNIAIQVGGGSVAGLLPAALLDSLLDERERDAPTTPGEAYASAGRGIGKAFLISLTTAVPAFVTWTIGEEQEKIASPGRAFAGAALGAGTGTMVASALLDARLPKWARIAISASLIGSLTTLGYQIGGGGRP